VDTQGGANLALAALAIIGGGVGIWLYNRKPAPAAPSTDAPIPASLVSKLTVQKRAT